MRGRAFGVTELEGESEEAPSIRAMTLRLGTAVGVDCDMVAIRGALTNVLKCKTKSAESGTLGKLSRSKCLWESLVLGR